MSLNVTLPARDGSTVPMPVVQYLGAALCKPAAQTGVMMALLGACNLLWSLLTTSPGAAPSIDKHAQLAALFLIASVGFFTLAHPVSLTCHRMVETTSVRFRLFRILVGASGALVFFLAGGLAVLSMAQFVTIWQATLMIVGIAGLGFGFASVRRG